MTHIGTFWGKQSALSAIAAVPDAPMRGENPVKYGLLARTRAQQGHCNTSTALTRRIKSAADSCACGLGAGIANAERACANVIALHPAASSP